MAEEASASLLEKPWTAAAEEVVEALQVDPEKGLDEAAVQTRQEEFGPNQLQEIKRRSLWEILVDQFKSLVVLLLVVAAGVSLAFGDWIDSIAIMIVVLINAAIGFFTEMKAVRSMEALRELGSVSARVRRDGQVKDIPAEALVPGDIVVVEGGDVITADLRLVKASKVEANESALTGESVPVAKQLEPIEAEAPLAERTNMLYKGTALTRGAGEGVVVAIGMETELGHISTLVEEAEKEATPLEQRLDQLGHRLVWITLAIAAVVGVLGILRGKEMLLMIETAIALAVAAIPEGLPIVATIALARGMQRMARQNALINRLAAVETLGGTNVICSDKTGTLTENQMTVICISLDTGEVEVSGEGLQPEGEFKKEGQTLEPGDNEALQQALQVGVLCNNAILPEEEEEEEEEKAIGDPVEIAMLIAGLKGQLNRDELLNEMPREREEAFDTETKMMATFHQNNGNFYVAVKGAPEPVIQAATRLLGEEGEKELTDEERQCWLDRNEQMAGEGLRVLALATKTVDNQEADPYQDLTLVGLMGLADPPRNDVQEAIRRCQEAGIKIVMVTGDQPVTARSIGQAVGLVEGDEIRVVSGQELKAPDQLSDQEKKDILETPILARVSPKQKLDLIEIHQKSGAIVAMTGDGVNDAPALKKADIGIAMGQRGTQVAREAADMVLKDDAFATIVAAVEQGRVIFDNIRKFVLFLLSCNISEIMVVGLASLINIPLPILPLQILFINLVTDVFPALALGVGKGDPSIMKRPPRDPEEPIMTRHNWWAMAVYGTLITLAVFGALWLALSWLGLEQTQARTISFLTLAAAQLWHVFNMRDRESPWLNNEITRNLYIWGALGLCFGLLGLAVYLPGLSNVLQVVDPGLNGWLMVLGMSLVPLLLGQLVKLTRLGEI